MLLHIKDDANGTIQVILGKSYFQIGSFYVTLIMFFLHTRTGPRGKWFSLSLLRMHRTTVWVLSAVIWALDVHTWIYTSCRSRKKHDKDPTNAKLEDPSRDWSPLSSKIKQLINDQRFNLSFSVVKHITLNIYDFG